LIGRSCPTACGSGAVTGDIRRGGERPPKRNYRVPRLIAEHEISIQWSDIRGRWRHARPKSADERSSGVHVSQIIKYCQETTGLLSKRTKTVDADDMPLVMALGMAWEDWVVGLYPDMAWQPGERHKDNIYGSPDGYTLLDDGTGQLEEFKATYKSRNTYGDPTKSSLWMWQLAAYCYLMDLTRARMHILWVCNDYRPPFPPSYRTYEIEFTKKEINDLWKNIFLKNRDKVRGEHY
jgi:hypothetical protein